MVYQSRIKNATRRTTLVLVFLCLCGIHTFASADNATANTATEPGAQQQPSPTPSVAPSAAMSPATDKMSQSQQGRQYGQPGFVGEPINLNVVNADIRDILNYITEQYGVNFVIDSSVAAVPVTVNVQDVPWNIALDAVLKANRLGVETSGNILRVATNEVLAKESETQKVINDSRLDASPLVTEFIRLNYARASGTLAQAAGSTGAFSGGATNLSFSGGAGGDATGGSGDQGLLPIISRRLSRRGSIEVDGRSNTLIITDVKENIDAIRQLAAAVRVALGRVDLLVCCGGLGPTDDDVTREAVADVLGRTLVEDERIVGQIAARFEARRMRMPVINRRQAMVPSGARVIDNRHGTAPGLWFDDGDRSVLLLPVR